MSKEDDDSIVSDEDTDNKVTEKQTSIDQVLVALDNASMFTDANISSTIRFVFLDAAQQLKNHVVNYYIMDPQWYEPNSPCRIRKIVQRGLDNRVFRWLLAPVYMPGHWVLAIIDVEDSKVFLYDPLGSKRHEAFKSAFRGFMGSERRLKHVTIFELTDGPRQKDGTSCGVWVLCAIWIWVSQQERGSAADRASKLPGMPSTDDEARSTLRRLITQVLAQLIETRPPYNKRPLSSLPSPSSSPGPAKRPRKEESPPVNIHLSNVCHQLADLFGFSETFGKPPRTLSSLCAEVEQKHLELKKLQTSQEAVEKGLQKTSEDLKRTIRITELATISSQKLQSIVDEWRAMAKSDSDENSNENSNEALVCGGGGDDNSIHHHSDALLAFFQTRTSELPTKEQLEHDVSKLEEEREGIATKTQNIQNEHKNLLRSLARFLYTGITKEEVPGERSAA
ncbi:hypothetical protein F5X98DRAFT_87324 [Xylaria grammica]|nr:hypothetical protein F5X98DRAFT_87324 [Xylaria grammica]